MRTPLPIRLSLSSTPDWLTLPASPGVVMLCSAEGAAVQIAATGSVRTFCKDRLDPEALLGPRADLRELTSEIRAVGVGSPLEGDLCALDLAQEHLPSFAETLATQAKVFALWVDCTSPSPAWKKGELLEMIKRNPEQERRRGSAAVLGPFADPSAPGKYAELLDSIFELCRYPRELALAPHGSPCAYKDMGCPGACDGSEPMESYLTRLSAAVAFASGTGAELHTRLTQQMGDASDAHHFEEAARLRATLELATSATRGDGVAGFGAVCALDQLSVLAVLPSEKFGVARVLLLSGGEVATLADVHADLAGEAWDELGPRVRCLVDSGLGHRLTAESAACLGVWCRHWFRPARKAKARRATFFQIRGALPTRKSVVSAVRHAAAATEHDEFFHTPGTERV